jgi:prepilin-type N-terminal cleavage/methylation domain-containing protein
MKNQKGFTIVELVISLLIAAVITVATFLLIIFMFARVADAGTCDYTVQIEDYTLYQVEPTNGSRAYIKEIKVKNIYKCGPHEGMKSWVMLVPCDTEKFGNKIYLHDSSILNIRFDGLETNQPNRCKP